MKIAITGGNGYVGNVVVRKLLKAGHQVKVLLYQHESVLPEHENLEYTKGDIRNPDDIMAFCEDVDTVIHCASFVTIVHYLNKKLEECNVGGTKNVIDACKANNVSKLVYVSSIEAVGKMHDGVHSEQDGFNPDHTFIPYGSSKARASNLVLDFGKEYQKSHNCNVSIVCPAGVMGPFEHGTTDLGRMVKKFIHRTLHAYPSRGGFCFIDVRDVAGAVINAITRGKNAEHYIASAEYMSVSDMMDLLEEVSGIKKPRIKLSLNFLYAVGFLIETITSITRSGAVITTGSINVLKSELHVSSEKMQKELGVIPRPLKVAFQDQIDWYHGKEVSLD